MLYGDKLRPSSLSCNCGMATKKGGAIRNQKVDNNLIMTFKET